VVKLRFGGKQFLESNEEIIMKVRIDYDLCMGDRNCNKVCPEVFQYDEDQLISRILMDTVPPNLEDLVRKAAEECAPGAIILEE
jgi:ferredoxin